ncbi:hypothetical protein L596_029226 [Steinernema carpocapsae]|uniref:Uncharacterized protein n=1 Tax=Steinernema carpocapsae TaxID=34508 RepID=A0A4U5LU05_STECR|nr:hypothetical protein L596_029226 [Steinernema carpocapsae]
MRGHGARVAVRLLRFQLATLLSPQSAKDRPESFQSVTQIHQRNPGPANHHLWLLGYALLPSLECASRP